MEEWEFWNIVRTNSNFLIFEDKLSFENLQKLNAVLEMDEDYNKVISEFHKEDMEIKNKLK